MRSLAPLLLVVLPLGACGGESSTTPDAPANQPDANQAQCLVKSSYGAVGSVTGVQTAGDGTVSATLEAGPPRDAFFIKLVNGKGVFASGLQTGTFTISGVDADYNNCGLCVHIIADIVAGSGPSKFYFANSGTVTLTSTTKVAGSAMNLHFNEVNLTTGAVIPGCETTMTSISFATQ
jgi:hypothetical protein